MCMYLLGFPSVLAARNPNFNPRTQAGTHAYKRKCTNLSTSFLSAFTPQARSLRLPSKVSHRRQSNPRGGDRRQGGYTKEQNKMPQRLRSNTSCPAHQRKPTTLHRIASHRIALYLIDPHRQKHVTCPSTTLRTPLPHELCIPGEDREGVQQKRRKTCR